MRYNLLARLVTVDNHLYYLFIFYFLAVFVGSTIENEDLKTKGDKDSSRLKPSVQIGKTIDSGKTLCCYNRLKQSRLKASRRSCMTHRKVRGVKIYDVPISLKLAGQKARDYIILFITETTAPEVRSQLKWAYSASVPCTPDEVLYVFQREIVHKQL